MEIYLDQVPYDAIIEHWNDRKEWSEWNYCLFLCSMIPCRKYGSDEFAIWRFARTYQVEEAIKKALGLSYTDNTHKALHPGYGETNPDFVDSEGKTYELKMTKKAPYNSKCWWNADVHLYFNQCTKELFEQTADDEYIKIMNLNVKLLPDFNEQEAE